MTINSFFNQTTAHTIPFRMHNTKQHNAGEKKTVQNKSSTYEVFRFSTLKYAKFVVEGEEDTRIMTTLCVCVCELSHNGFLRVSLAKQHSTTTKQDIDPQGRLPMSLSTAGCCYDRLER